ncbi:NAD-dependent epimerase/dehydratase family protein [Cohnella herbarum]|uniref:NAD-dependent epimerase/dehydratase family protein n=1 Tax=Cohnella herbarum TaxID=2728023 RepID=A0A7Z2VLF0_9BACL|nr:NAD-dependent epimerase/dehydratase family protein [Cohnella herbarum]QJD85217.1 NAD-dependent epimerase/dehydratase family protein [Cohnella herbarum]
MIKWIKPYLGTASYNHVQIVLNESPQDWNIIDVRDLVDKSGNSPKKVKQYIDEAVDLIESGKKVVICCDYGMSRSNAVASGILSKQEEIPLDDAVRTVLKSTGETSIKIEMINIVRNAIDRNDTRKSQSSGKSAVLITGAMGFIGSRLVKRLGELDEISIHIPNQLDLENEAVQLDLFVKDHGIDSIIHLANPRIYTINRSVGKSITMLTNVLNVCLENNIRLIYPSNWEVYSGYQSEKMYANEALPLLPKGTYGETKYLSELLIKHYINYFNLNVTILRFSTIYGHGSDKPRFIYNFINKAKKNEDIITHMYTNGIPELDLLHIEDAVESLHLALQKNISGDYNIGSGIAIATKDVAGLIVDLSNSKSSISHVDIDGFTANITMNTSKFNKMTGWQPSKCFNDWIKERVNKVTTNNTKANYQWGENND